MFTILEKNRKTFLLVQKYIEYLEGEGCSCVKLDNRIEMEEIGQWLEEVSADVRDTEAVTEWIRKNGKSFRDYLNTVKLIYLVWYCMGGRGKPLSWDDFCAIGDNLNYMKNTCLDSIY